MGELRPGADLGQCDAMGSGADSSFLHVMMRVNGLGETANFDQYDNELERKAFKTIRSTPQLVP